MKRPFNSADLNEIGSSLKNRADILMYQGELDDLGNEIGIIVGTRYTNFSEEDLEDFLSGIRHGISLTNGTHG